MPTVRFVNRLPGPPAQGLFIDLRESVAPATARSGPLREVSLAAIGRRHGEVWQRSFVEWLGALNTVNARLEWWAYTSTAKNQLSSPLGNRLFQVLAVLRFIDETQFDKLFLLGATPAQRSIVRRWLAAHHPGTAVERDAGAPGIGPLEIAARLAWQALRIGAAMARWKTRFAPPVADVYAVTYVDAKSSDGNDAFFGQLPALLAAQPPGLRLGFLAYVLGPFPAVLPRLATFRRHAYWPLMLGLAASDVVWAFFKSARAYDTRGFRLEAAVAGLDAAPLLAEAFRWDVAKGGYLHNLLTYRAMSRFARAAAPTRVLFPFENKSLEKLLVLGLRAGAPAARIVGYQHTSITPRHTTMLFAPGEARATPLPDIIVTVGDVTRRYLEEHGNYPAGMLATGCALRQATGIAAAPEQPGKTLRVLLALSSSRHELACSVEFFKSVKALVAGLELGIRPHPEFPLTLLPETLREWVAAHARDLSQSSLADNIAWSQAVAYVSSTVALEAMLHGRPAINIDLGEMVVPDPVLDAPPLKRRASSPAEFLRLLEALDARSASERALERERTRGYLESYFRRPDARGLAAFLQ